MALHLEGVHSAQIKCLNEWFAMFDSSPPLGQRFSHIYIMRGVAAQDSERMRIRCLKLFDQLVLKRTQKQFRIKDVLEAELGIILSWTATGVDWQRFFRKCDLRDLLDCITLVYQTLNNKQHPSVRSAETLPANWWLDGIKRIFREENIGYRIDEKGGVHLAVDGEYEHNCASVIGALNSSRYDAVRDSFSMAQQALDCVPPDGKGAMVAVFGAVESLFRMMAYARASGSAEYGGATGSTMLEQTMNMVRLEGSPWPMVRAP